MRHATNPKRGVRLRECRWKLEMNVAQVSLASGVPANTIWAWEDGFNPTCDGLLRLAKYYRVSVDWILTGEEALQCTNPNCRCSSGSAYPEKA